MASRVLQPLRPGRPPPLLLQRLPPPCGPPGLGPAPGQPSPARPRARFSPLPAAAGGLPGPARAPGARAFSRAGPACRSKRPVYRHDDDDDDDAGPKERRYIDKRKIVLSWLPPGRPVRLLFYNGEAARAAQEDYKSGAVTVLGQRVAATSPRHGVKPFGWGMSLLGVPDAATRDDIVRGLGPDVRPRHVDVGAKMPEADVDAMAASLKEKAEAYGPVLQWRYPIPAPRRIRIGVGFEYPASAEEATKALDRHLLKFPNGTHARLAVNADPAIQLRIPSRQYRVTRDTIETALGLWRQKRAEFLTRSTKDGHILLTVVGNDRIYETLLDAAQAVEDILDGHLVVSENGKSLWHPGLDPIFKKVKALQDELPVYIVRGQGGAELRVSGPEPACRNAMKRIAAIIKEATSHEEPPSHDQDGPFH